LSKRSIGLEAEESIQRVEQIALVTILQCIYQTALHVSLGLISNGGPAYEEFETVKITVFLGRTGLILLQYRLWDKFFPFIVLLYNGRYLLRSLVEVSDIVGLGKREERKHKERPNQSNRNVVNDSPAVVNCDQTANDVSSEGSKASSHVPVKEERHPHPAIIIPPATPADIEAVYQLDIISSVDRGESL
jgi:hypothetical protein